MQPSHDVEAVRGRICGLISDLPSNFRVIHESEGLALWTDGVHYGGAVVGLMDFRAVNTIVGKYGLGLRESWKDDSSAGVYILSLCELEGRDLK